MHRMRKAPVASAPLQPDGQGGGPCARPPPVAPPWLAVLHQTSHIGGSIARPRPPQRQSCAGWLLDGAGSPLHLVDHDGAALRACARTCEGPSARSHCAVGRSRVLSGSVLVSLGTDETSSILWAAGWHGAAAAPWAIEGGAWSTA